MEFLDLYRFSLLFTCFQRFRGLDARQPVATCGALWRRSPAEGCWMPDNLWRPVAHWGDGVLPGELDARQPVATWGALWRRSLAPWNYFTRCLDARRLDARRLRGHGTWDQRPGLACLACWLAYLLDWRSGRCNPTRMTLREVGGFRSGYGFDLQGVGRLLAKWAQA
jgi:hypothetical protein